MEQAGYTPIEITKIVENVKFYEKVKQELSLPVVIILILKL